eukprot:a513443_19.p2 GENE.a513443_19~~a513443_19.p2  ORF type:complete len:220 (+),score=57.55 a513443_19:58-660(+)
MAAAVDATTVAHGPRGQLMLATPAGRGTVQELEGVERAFRAHSEPAPEPAPAALERALGGQVFDVRAWLAMNDQRRMRIEIEKRRRVCVMMLALDGLLLVLALFNDTSTLSSSSLAVVFGLLCCGVGMVAVEKKSILMLNTYIALAMVGVLGTFIWIGVSGELILRAMLTMAIIRLRQDLSAQREMGDIDRSSSTESWGV